MIARGAFLVAGLALLLLTARARAQELTPGAYWPLPTRLNIVSITNNISWGDLTFDPSLPVEDASATINTTSVAYTRTLGIAGRSANLGLQVPVVTGQVEGLYNGAFTRVDRFGFGDPRVRLGLILFGAPPMTPREFASYRLHALLGVSLVVVPPLGEYDNTKVINIGTNRWSFKPEIGYSHATGPWIVELMAGAWLFTDNTDFLRGSTREQQAIGAGQAHLTYRFGRKVWIAADANYYTGGQTTVGGTRKADLQRNSRVGMTFSWAIDRHHSVRAAVSRGAKTSIGADFTSVAVGYNYAWGH
jgi:hypothetical protein